MLAGASGYQILSTYFPPDSNVIRTAEQHQQGAGSSDVVFGLALDVLARPSQLGLELPRLSIERDDAAVRLLWSAPGWVLQHATSPQGSWQSIPAASSPYLVSTVFPRRYFRLAR